jgi:hypothetical protein
LILQNATQPAPNTDPQVLVFPTQSFSTPTMIPTATPTPESTPEISERDRKNNMYSIIAIGIAALFLGGLFTVMTRQKPI